MIQEIIVLTMNQNVKNLLNVKAIHTQIQCNVQILDVQLDKSHMDHINAKKY